MNLSKSGVGISAGVKGARVGIGPKGLYFAGGLGGLYFMKRLGSSGKGRASELSPLAIMAAVAAAVAIVLYLGRALYWAYYHCVTIPWLAALVSIVAVGAGIVAHEPAFVFLGLLVVMGGMVVLLLRMFQSFHPGTSASAANSSQAPRI